MHRIQIDQDIQPLSEFRSKVAFYFDKVKKTKRPLIITQNGKSSAILLDVSEYQSMVDKIELLEDIKIAEEQINHGASLPHSEVKKKFAKRFK
jgi:antitoxin YefM